MVFNVPLLLVTLLHATAPKPHVVFLLADDLGWANVGWHRDPPTLEVQTPTYVWPSCASFYFSFISFAACCDPRGTHNQPQQRSPMFGHTCLDPAIPSLYNLAP